MKKWLLILLVGVMATGTLLAGEQATTSEEGVLPESWEQYVRHVTGGNDLGTWIATGKTAGIFEGIPAGLDFTFVLERRLGDNGNTVLGSYIQKTADGRVISTGTQVTYWDSESGMIKSSSSGFDTGEPYTGIYTPLGIDFGSGTERWSYVEKSRGETTEYLVENSRTGTNQRLSDYDQVDGSGAIHFKFKRANPLEGVLARFDILGTWEITRPDGSRTITRHSGALDGRAVFSGTRNVGTDGTSEEVSARGMWWDAKRKKVRFQVFTSRGGSFTGEMISLTTEGDSSTMVIRYRGANENGIAMSGTFTRVLTGDSLVSTFSDFSREDRPRAPGQSSQSSTWKRTGRD
ncbi:MAG: hypothetical protein VX435_03605 [Planctomycetota bacterium]|nr:hypothetical protein [Planctomycetota bacterium]